MKKVSLIVITCISVLFITACSSSKGAYKVVSLSKNGDNIDTRDGIVYTLPKTVLNFDVRIKKQEFEKGIYSDYSEKLLGIKAFSTEKKTLYSIDNVRLSITAEADIEQYYAVIPDQSSNLSVSLSPEGFLQWINNPNARKSDMDKREQRASREELTSLEKYILATNSLLPPPQDEQEFIVKKRYENDSLIEEVVPVKPVAFSEKSLEVQAKEAAKFIKTIQEKKIQLISGEYEDQYSPNAVEFLYKKLETVEKQYMELFTGTYRVNSSTYTFSVAPQKNQLSNNEAVIPVFGFSENEGILPTDSPAKKTLFSIRLHCDNILKTLNNNLSTQKSDDILYGFYYRIPESTTIYYTVGSEERKEKIYINQFGTVMNLPHLNLKASFDANTGNVLEYKRLKKN